MMHDVGCDFARPVDENGNQLEHSDAAKRVADAYMLHRVADKENSPGQWFAVRLDDGSSDHTLYETRADCIRHQRGNALWFAYIQVQLCGMNICQAESVLYFHRKAYKANGELLADPDRQIIPALTRRQFREQLRGRMNGIIGIPTGKANQ